MRAMEEGIPYQTLMASVLHKYISGRLIEMESWGPGYGNCPNNQVAHLAESVSNGFA